jgi:hypothetical protein
MSERSPKQSGKSALGFAEGRVARDARAAGRGPSLPVRHLATPTDRLLELLREANVLAASPLVDDERREAFMARKYALLAEMERRRP